MLLSAHAFGMFIGYTVKECMMVVCEGAQLFQHDDVIFAIDGTSHIE